MEKNDEAAKVYHFSAYNDGRYLDTELKVPENGFEWGYKAGPVDLRFVMRLNDKGECGDRRREIRRQSTPADIRDDLAQAELGRKE